MSKAKPIDLGLKHVDELFMDDAERAELKLPRIHDIPLEQIDDFPEHPFKVRNDEDKLKLSLPDLMVPEYACLSQKLNKLELLAKNSRFHTMDTAPARCQRKTGISQRQKNFPEGPGLMDHRRPAAQAGR